MEQTLMLKMTDIEKSFNGVQVLKKVPFEVLKGEVHALMGENGAGKSTLIKILTGIYPKEGGEIYIDGTHCDINSKTDATKCGVAAIYQELSVIPTLTVWQNVMLGKEKSALGLLKTSLMKKQVADLITRYGFHLKPDDIVESLTIAQRQMVEILKSLIEDSKILIMDEPTASLSSKESESLFQIIEQLRDQGVSIIYISHRLEEVYRLSDRLTVLRDGQKVATLTKDEINPAKVIKLMIGKELSEATASNSLRKSAQEVVLDIKDLTKKGVFKNVNFQVHRGEILGIGGLVGAGRTEVVRCIFGADRYDSGKILFEGNELPGSVAKTIGLGFGFVPEDRRNQGFIPLLSIEKNGALTNYDTLARQGIVDRKKEKEFGLSLVDDLDVRPKNSLVHVENLSGGNQQKVVLGKWLGRDLKILIVDEPTAGIDVGAKDEIYKILENLAAQGTCVIVVSSDLQELLTISHRILVFRKGSIFKEFASGVITQEDILMAASGIEEEKEASDHE